MSTPSDDRPADLETSQAVNGDGTQVESEPVATTQPSFGGLTPQEAGRRSAQRRAEQARRQEAEQLANSDGRVLMLRVPVHLGDIVSALNTQAKKGNTQAARELREWMREYPAEDATDLAALDSRTQREVLNRVLGEIIEDEGQAPLAPVIETASQPS